MTKNHLNFSIPCQKFHEAEKIASEIILNKEHQIKLTFICFLAQGHLLIEDLPGVGKTTLAQTLALLFGLKQSRIQFTNDLLPSDIIGISILSPEKQKFNFVPGPLFSEVVLADELNRANPRTQSALLQAMEEQQVTVDRETLPLPRPFYLIATQNPRSQIGTYPLPESQIDRFLMSIHLDYMSLEAEEKIYMGQDPRQKLANIQPLFSRENLVELQKQIEMIFVDQKVAHYVASLIQQTRLTNTAFRSLSTRAGLALIKAAKAAAYLNQRSFVIPDDIQFVAPAVLAHRLGENEGLHYGENQCDELLKTITAPN